MSLFQLLHLQAWSELFFAVVCPCDTRCSFKQKTYKLRKPQKKNLPNIFGLYNNMLWCVPPGPAFRLVYMCWWDAWKTHSHKQHLFNHSVKPYNYQPIIFLTAVSSEVDIATNQQSVSVCPRGGKCSLLMPKKTHPSMMAIHSIVVTLQVFLLVACWVTSFFSFLTLTLSDGSIIYKVFWPQKYSQGL